MCIWPGPQKNDAAVMDAYGMPIKATTAGAAKEAGVHYNSVLKWVKAYTSSMTNTVKVGAEKAAAFPGDPDGEAKCSDRGEERKD